MNVLTVVRSLFNRRLERRHLRSIYERCRDFTMVPQETFILNLILAQQTRRVDGCVVECGVWRGGMSAGLAMLLGPTRRYYLFDSFRGLPPPKSIDGEAALAWHKNTTSRMYYDNCSAPPEFARRAMTLSGATSFELVEGWFEETLPKHKLGEPIALLRLDGDWYDSIIVCLECLYDRVTAGGIIVLDDYYVWDGCSRALHDFLSRRAVGERIRSRGEVCYLKKQSCNS